METVRYVGKRTRGEVSVTREREDGTNETLSPRLDLAKKSPTGFEWGYNGSGPAQLALAILSDAVGDKRALPNFQRFKFAVVGRLPQDGWTLTRDEVLDWFAREAKPEEMDELVDEIADLFWEQAAERFKDCTADMHRSEAMFLVEKSALDFLGSNPWLWKEQGLDPVKLAEAIADRMP